jgi:hypothetical protein
MVRKSETVSLSDARLAQNLDTSILTLRTLCEAYDAGSFHVAFSMTNEVRKILIGNPYFVRVRGEKKFKTARPFFGEGTQVLRDSRGRPFVIDGNIMPENRLIAVRSGQGTVIFVPTSLNEHQGALLSFRDWWNRDVIYRDGSSATPRRQLTRREFVDDMRNRLGSHSDTVLPELLDELQRHTSWGATDISINFNGQTLSVSDGTLPVLAGPSSAMSRRIAAEVLDAYGY